MFRNEENTMRVFTMLFVTVVLNYTLYYNLTRTESLEGSFWAVMKTPLVLGVMLTLWSFGWDSWRTKRKADYQQQSSQACAQKIVAVQVVSKVAQVLGLALWGYFYIRVAILAQASLPAIFLMPGYLILMTGVVLVVALGCYVYYRKEAKGN